MTIALEARAALITGASHGLGVEIARAFLRAGADISIVARDGTRLDAVASELRAHNPARRVLASAADVSDQTAMAMVVAKTHDAFGRIDCLVNNAGVLGPQGCIEDVDLTEWARTVEINLFGTVIPIRCVVSLMKRAGYGKIINLSGGGATGPRPRLTAYAASKAAVVRLTESVAHETRAFGIDVNAVAPGALNTRLLDEVLAAGPDRVGHEVYTRALEQRAMGGASLENAANLCVYLASAASNGVTGRLISAVWDDWSTLQAQRDRLAATDVYTLRRITWNDRGIAGPK